MTSYVDVFGTDSIPTSGVEFATYSLTADAVFSWPYNYSGANYVAKLMEISCSAGVELIMPAADEVSNGESCIIRNIGSETLVVLKLNGAALTTIAAGSSALVYVKDNSSDAGVWGSFTYGTGSSAADAATLAGYGVTAIGSVLNAALQTETQSSAFAVDIYDRAKLFIFTGGVETATLPDVTTLPDDWFCIIKNAGSGVLTIDADGAQTINDQLTLSLNPGESAFLVSTNTKWFEVGQGRSVDYQFTQLIKDVTTGTPFTLTSAEASNKILKFIGTPAADVTVIVPPIVSIYYTNNALSAAKSVTVKTSAGAGVVIDQTRRATLFCDGVNVLDAQTAEVSRSISLIDGTVSAPSLNYTTSTNSGLYKISGGIGLSIAGVNLANFDANGFSVTSGYLKLPGATSPSQIAEGAMVWDTDDDLLTIGTGSARKTIVDTNSSQALTNKTLTDPVISMSTSVTTLDGTETFSVTQTTAKKSTVQKILDWMLDRANTWTGTQTFSGDTSVPTQTSGDASNKIANTLFVQTAIMGVTWVIKTTNYTAVSTDAILADTTTLGAFTITMPLTPSQNDIVRVADYAGSFPTNALTIDWNGAKHKGLSDATMTINYLPVGTLDMVYVDSTIGWTF